MGAFGVAACRTAEGPAVPESRSPGPACQIEEKHPAELKLVESTAGCLQDKQERLAAKNTAKNARDLRDICNCRSDNVITYRASIKKTLARGSIINRIRACKLSS